MNSLSIGALASASGIPANTLRTWERRYGFPAPRRTEGGHRLYDPSDLERLRLIAEALDRGLRAGQVVPAQAQELRELLGPASVRERRGLMDHALGLDAPALGHALQLALAEQGIVEFGERTAGPFLERLGEGWASGELDVHQEHTASYRLRALLERFWQPLSSGNAGPALVFATPPGEQHDLGLHLAASVAAAQGYRVVFFGADVPPQGLARGVEEISPRAVMISLSTHRAASARADLGALRTALGDRVELVCGGSGAQGVELTGVLVLEGLSALRAWCRG